MRQHRGSNRVGLCREQMLTDMRKLLDRLAERAGWGQGEIRTRPFPHMYCAARLQTRTPAPVLDLRRGVRARPPIR
jgi:hypothetical protein